MKAPDRQRAKLSTSPRPHPCVAFRSIMADTLCQGADWQLRQLIGFGCRIGKPINRFCGFI